MIHWTQVIERKEDTLSDIFPVLPKGTRFDAGWTEVKRRLDWTDRSALDRRLMAEIGRGDGDA